MMSLKFDNYRYKMTLLVQRGDSMGEIIERDHIELLYLTCIREEGFFFIIENSILIHFLCQIQYYVFIQNYLLLPSK